MPSYYSEVQECWWHACELRRYSKTQLGGGPTRLGNEGMQIDVFHKGFLILNAYMTEVANQVPLLLDMKEDRLALMKVVNSEDTDLSALHLADCFPF